MYGTVMIGTLAAGCSVEDVDLALKAFFERRVDGFEGEDVLLNEDGRTFVTAVRFRDKAAYQALAADPAQGEWYAQHLAPLLDGDAQWVDGDWVRSYAPL